MPRPLPEFIDPMRLSGKGRALQGSFAISRLRRIRDLLLEEDFADSDSVVSVELAFGVDANGQANMTGRVDVALWVLCQRCLQAMRWQQEIPVRLAFVSSELEAEEIESLYEPYLLTTEFTATPAGEGIANEKAHSLIDIIESEIILALPQETKHSDEECAISGRYSVRDDVSSSHKIGVSNPVNEGSTLSKQNPFAMLKQLKSEKDENDGE